MNWIDVKKKLPSFNIELSDWVLAWDGKRVGLAFYSRCNNEHTWQSNMMNCSSITHWQPLPKAPK